MDRPPGLYIFDGNNHGGEFGIEDIGTNVINIQHLEPRMRQ